MIVNYAAPDGEISGVLRRRFTLGIAMQIYDNLMFKQIYCQIFELLILSSRYG